MQFEDDYNRRRAYVSRRNQQRKRQRNLRILIFTLILIFVIAAVLIGIFAYKKKKGSSGDPGNLETGIVSATGGSNEISMEITADDKTPTAAPQGSEELLQKADALAVTYDYDGAIELLNSSAEWKDTEEVKAAIADYENAKASLVKVDPAQVTHIFFHSLIMDNSKAFDGDSDEKGYNQVMTTKSEFLKILDQMYERGFVLVKMHDIAHEETDANGEVHMVPGEIMLPPGKKPVVISQDDVCYYDYMTGDGFASRLVIGEDGKPTCEMIMDDGTVSTGSYDLIPLLEDFVTEHPDFSYKGARAVIAFTGYQGVMGYRTDPAYKDSNPNFEEDKETVRKLAQCLKDNNWEIASHSWGHINFTTRSLDTIKTDTQKWKDYVEPLIGQTDILLYPYGADIADWHPYTMENEKYTYLYGQGFRFFCNVDSNPYWVQITDKSVRQGRRNLDGFRMYYCLPDVNPGNDKLSDLFDVTTVFDSDRPTPVPPMSGN